MITRFQHLLGRTLGVHHDDFKEILGAHVEKLD
jgi:hypothetical protein